LALISKSCCESYQQVQHIEEQHLDVYDTLAQVLTKVTVAPQMTLHKAVFTSPAYSGSIPILVYMKQQNKG
jgi:hypothetical protein